MYRKDNGISNRTITRTISALVSLYEAEERKMKESPPTPPGRPAPDLITPTLILPVTCPDAVRRTPVGDRHKGGSIVFSQAALRYARLVKGGEAQKLLLIGDEIGALMDDAVFCLANCRLFDVEQIYPFHKMCEDFIKGMKGLVAMDKCLKDLDKKYAELPGKKWEAQMRTQYVFAFLSHAYLALSAAYDSMGRAVHLLVHRRDNERCTYNGVVGNIEAQEGKRQAIRSATNWRFLADALDDYRSLSVKRNTLAHRASWARLAREPWDRDALPDAQAIRDLSKSVGEQQGEFVESHYRASVAFLALGKLTAELTPADDQAE